MEWYNLFKSHILDRGAQYHQDGYVSSFNMTEQGITAVVEGTKKYHVDIELDGENVIDMICDCPYAEDGHNCKHMAAVLFRFEEELYSEDMEKGDESEDESKHFSWSDYFAEEKEKAVELVNIIPEDVVREMLVNYVLHDNSLRNRLELEYSQRFDVKHMLALKNEINDIIQNNSVRGFVDWYHAPDFTSSKINNNE